MASHVDHRLDGEAAARRQHHARSGLGYVADEGIFMELQADAVAAELAHHREAA